MDILKCTESQDAPGSTLYGVIDIGSNTIVLIIYDSADPVHVKDYYSEPVHLVSYNIGGRMQEEGIQKAKDVLEQYRAILYAQKVGRVFAFITEPWRRLSNAQEFLSQLNECGIRIDPLSGREEAEYDFYGSRIDCSDVLTGMIVDIGGGSTEIAVISLGGIVSNNSIRTAGDDLTADIQEYMSRQHNVKVSERMAERIKIHVGSALTDLGDEAPEDFIVHGPNRITALPMEVPVCYQEIAHCLDKTIAKIENAVLSALENTPPELYADIVKNGIYLSGGGALLRGLDKRLEDKIHIPFHIADDPLHSVAKGAGIALKNVERFSFLMR